MDKTTERALINTLLNLRHDEAEMDCGHLVILTQQRLFGRHLDVPTRHPRGRLHQAALIERLCAAIGLRVREPEHGDVALYTQADPKSGDAYFHLATVLLIAGERWLLHVRVGGRSRLEREADALRMGLQLEGYYKPLPAVEETR